MHNNLNKYFDSYLTSYFSCREIKIATFLDPRYKLISETDKILAKQTLLVEYNKLNAKYPIPLVNNSESNNLIQGLDMMIMEES